MKDTRLYKPNEVQQILNITRSQLNCIMRPKGSIKMKIKHMSPGRTNLFRMSEIDLIGEYLFNRKDFEEIKELMRAPK